ncbi:MAG: phage virion morphogenesis protein [Nitrospirota bacterium]
MSYVEFNAQQALAALTGLRKDLAGEVANNIVGRLAKNVFEKAFDNLSGPRIPKKKWRKSPLAGSWPVPVRTGQLRRSLYMIGAGGLKQGDGGGKYSVGPGEAYVGDSAKYAGEIEDGPRGNKRPFLTEPAREYLGLAPRIADEELKKVVEKHGLE